MMKGFFLGKTWHWAVLVVAAALLWYCGSKRLHVIEFNWFIIAMLFGTAVAVFAIIRLHRGGEQVTREALLAQPFDPEADAGPARD